MPQDTSRIDTSESEEKQSHISRCGRTVKPDTPLPPEEQRQIGEILIPLMF